MDKSGNCFQIFRCRFSGMYFSYSYGNELILGICYTKKIQCNYIFITSIGLGKLFMDRNLPDELGYKL